MNFIYFLPVGSGTCRSRQISAPGNRLFHGVAELSKTFVSLGSHKLNAYCLLSKTRSRAVLNGESSQLASCDKYGMSRHIDLDNLGLNLSYMDKFSPDGLEKWLPNGFSSLCRFCGQGTVSLNH